MGKKYDAPPQPDYSAVAEASEEASRMSFELGQQQLAWAKEVYAKDSAITGRVVDSFLSAMDRNDTAAAADRARYQSVFQPLEDDLIADARDYASPERKDIEVGRAQSQVSQQFTAARDNATRELEAFGINPSATRYGALDIGLRAQEAAAKAAAANNASSMVDAKADALRSEALNIGKGYPGQIAQAYGTAAQQGQGAVQGTLGQTASGAQTMGTMPQYMGLGNQALAGWGNILNTGYQNQLAGAQAEASASSGWGSALGLIGGLAFGLEDGGAVPEQLSPTRGAVADDVPANLSPGEFIMPEDAVHWFGEKHFYNLIAKAGKERDELKSETGAVPGVMPAAQQALPGV